MAARHLTVIHEIEQTIWLDTPKIGNLFNLLKIQSNGIRKG